MAQTFQQFMTDALAEAGLSDGEVTAALGKLYANEKLSTKLNGVVKTAMEDFKAEQGRVAQLRKDSELREAQVQKYYSDTNAEYQRVLAELKKGVETGVPAGFDPAKYLTKEDLQAAQMEMGNRFASVLKDVNAISSEHMQRFHEPLDLEEIEKVAKDNSLTIRQAYKTYIEPRAADEAKKANEKWKEETRKEIEKDIRSQHKLPVDPRPAEVAPIYARHEKNSAPANMDQELLEAWHGVATK